MTPVPVASRFKDALWSARRAFGMEPFIDPMIRLVAFPDTWTLDQIDKRLTPPPPRISASYEAAFYARLYQAMTHFRIYSDTKKGYQKVIRDITSIEDVVRLGFEGCNLVDDPNRGYRLELK